MDNPEENLKQQKQELLEPETKQKLTEPEAESSPDAINMALNKSTDSEEGPDETLIDTEYSVEKEELDEDDYIYKTTMYRWLILISYMLVMMSSGFSQTTFASVSEVVAKIYDISALTVNTCVALFFFAYLIFIIPIIWWIDNYGTTIPLKLYAFFLLIGVWGRYIILERTQNFPLIIIPQTILAVLSPVTSLTLSQISTNWFDDKGRALATSIGSLAAPIGAMLGFLIGPVYIENSDELITNIDKGHKDVV